jgi:hypothetical protein
MAPPIPGVNFPEPSSWRGPAASTCVRQHRHVDGCLDQREAVALSATGGARQRHDESAAGVNEIGILHSIRRRRASRSGHFRLHGDDIPFGINGHETAGRS